MAEIAGGSWIEERLPQRLNASSGMSVRDAQRDRSMTVSLEHSKNACSPMEVTELGRLGGASLEQMANAPLPMAERYGGSWIEERFSHMRNAVSGMVVRETQRDRSMSVSVSQSKNADAPMEVTEAGRLDRPRS